MAAYLEQKKKNGKSGIGANGDTPMDPSEFPPVGSLENLPNMKSGQKLCTTVGPNATAAAHLCSQKHKFSQPAFAFEGGEPVGKGRGKGGGPTSQFICSATMEGKWGRTKI